MVPVFLLFPLSALGSEAGAASVGIADAINSAITNNLTTKLAATQDAAIRAKVIQSASALLPNVLGTASQSRVLRENLDAMIGSGGVAGPFNVFDMRIQLSQSLLDIGSIERYAAAKSGLDYSRQAQELAREQVATAAALSYIEAARAHKAVLAAQADYTLASTLLELATHQHENGIVTGLDVTRARTRFSDAKVALLNAQSAERQAGIRLKRVAGWPLTGEIALKEEITDDVPALANIEGLLPLAENRADVMLCRTQVKMNEQLLSSKKSSRLPTISVFGNYGLSGNEPDGAVTTNSIGAGLSIPLFAGGRITGEIAQAKSDLDSAEAQLVDVKNRVEEDVRLSYEIAQEAQHETTLAAETVALAQEELAMSQDRYIQGIGDNVELVTAQVELAKVRNSYVAAQARNQQARINLAAATGRAQSFTLR
jgi:outer membrane protein TolC